MKKLLWRKLDNSQWSLSNLYLIGRESSWSSELFSADELGVVEPLFSGVELLCAGGTLSVDEPLSDEDPLVLEELVLTGILLSTFEELVPDAELLLAGIPVLVGEFTSLAAGSSFLILIPNPA